MISANLSASDRTANPLCKKASTQTFMTDSEFKPEHIENYFGISTTYGYFSSEKEIQPLTYLEFAKEDLAEGQIPRHRVNSIGNAKRALHFRIEMLCEALGWEKSNERKKKDFPNRMVFLAKCGILSPNILKKLNKQRNELEHDYYVPSIEETEDYIDIVELFLMATKDLLDSFPSKIDYELMEDESYETPPNLPKRISVRIEMSQGKLEVDFQNGNKIQKEIWEKDYFSWLSAIMRQHTL